MKLGFKYGKREINFNLIYRNRKTMSIEVEPNGEINVISPMGINEDTIIEKVKSRATWIVQKQYETKFISDTKIEREAVSGESFMYLGRNYTLDVVLDESIESIDVKLYRGKFVVRTYTKDEQKIKEALKKWYKDKTLSKVKERINYYQGYFKDEVTICLMKQLHLVWNMLLRML